MKKILKLFPVALAAFAMVSCSDDLSFGDKTAQLPENALRFSMESQNDATRAGVVGNVMASTSQLSFRWNKDDAIRVYNNTFAAWDKYVYGGAEFGSDDAFTTNAAESELNGQYTVGVYPFDQVEAVYRDANNKKAMHIVMNLDAERTYKEGLDKDAVGSAGYSCNMPMYGKISNLANAVNEMNFLTAWTRIYVRDLPKDMKYIVLVAKNTGAPLTGKFKAFVPETITLAADGSDDAPILKTEEAYETTYGHVMYARVNTTKYTTEAGDDNKAAVKDSALVCFPVLANNSTTAGTPVTYEDIAIYAWGDNTNVNKKPTAIANDKWDDEVTAGRAIKIDSRPTWTPKRRRSVWTVRFDNVKTLSLVGANNKPGNVSDKVIEYANTSIDSLVIQTTGGKMEVAAGDDSRDHDIELPKMKYGAPITLDFRATSSGINLNGNSLTIRDHDITSDANRFDGTLYIYPGDATADGTYIINLPKAKVVLAGESAHALSKVRVENAISVQIGDGVTTPVLGQKAIADYKETTNYEADEAVAFTIQKGIGIVAKGARVNEVILQDGVITGGGKNTPTGLEIRGGQVGNVRCNASADTYVKLYDGKVFGAIRGTSTFDAPTGSAKEVTIYSEGKSFIQDVFGEWKRTTITSKWTVDETTGLGAVCDEALPTQTFDGLIDGGVKSARIFTAAMLAKMQTNPTGGYCLCADWIDMNNLVWNGGIAGGEILFWGFNKGGVWRNQKAGNSAWKQHTKSEKNVLKNLNIKVKDYTGLFVGNNSNKATFFGLELQGVKLQADATETAAVDINNAGILLGYFNGATNPLTIHDVTIDGATLVNGGGTNSNNIGALVGVVQTSATANIDNVLVKDATIKGHYFVGGIIGQVQNNSNINMSNVRTSNLAFSIYNTSNYGLTSWKAGTFGTFVGGALYNAKIKLYDCKHGTVPYATAAKKIELRFRDNVLEDLPFYSGNPWIGHVVAYGNAQNGSATLVSYKTTGNVPTNTAKGRNFFKYDYNKGNVVRTAWKDDDGYNPAGGYDGFYEEKTQLVASNASDKPGAGFNASKPETITYSGAASQNHTTAAWVETTQFGYNIWKNYDATSAYDETFSADYYND